MKNRRFNRRFCLLLSMILLHLTSRHAFAQDVPTLVAKLTEAHSSILGIAFSPEKLKNYRPAYSVS